MTEQVLRTIYTSAADQDLVEQDLVSILEVSRHNNARRGITGALAFHDHQFIQILEGPPGLVEELLGTINADSRHGDLMVLDRSPVDERIFPEWSMGWLRSSDLAQAGFDPLILQLKDTPSAKVNIMLKVFREVVSLN
ncbi:BLUF domain-containing protein [Geminicoccus roseus]|uniref:BLUF domain-containing protein n=1 Tax=Geminicoccus roseus TaxID=404900 RepID=UPI000419FB63|nr:BLUF domain-containing protein [Geminicoccus roseus]